MRSQLVSGGFRAFTVVGSVAALAAYSACSDDDAADTAGPDMGAVDTGVRPPDSGADPVVDAGSEDSGPALTSLSIPGLSDSVTVTYDQRGIPSLSCASDADCFRAQGYIHAKYRFGQMDLRRRSVRGGISEFAGTAALSSDLAALTFFSNRMGEPLAEQLLNGASDGSKAMISAYTAGINAWIEDLRAGRNDARLTLEWDAYSDRIEPWEDVDSVACILALVESLTNQTGTEIGRGEAFARLGPAQATDLFGLRPANESTVLPSARGAVDVDEKRASALSELRSLQDYLRPFESVLNSVKLPERLHGIGPGEGFGSNNWVVAPSRTANGKALLANDPHLGMTNPSIWFLMNIDAKTRGGSIHVAGATFAGLPLVILGQNEDIAWGATTTFFDQADVYLEQLSPDRTGVIFNGEVVPFIQKTFNIEVGSGAPETRIALYVPHHGPVVAIDTDAGTAVTIKWTAQDATTDLDFILGMATSSSVDEAQAVLEAKVTTLGQNLVVADTAGNIGWFPYNNVPNRPWAQTQPSWLPLPGGGAAEWDGFLAKVELPQAENPASGYVATANNDMTGALWDGDPTNDGQPMLQHFTAMGYRHARIVERIEGEGNNNSLETTQSAQSDIFSLLGQELAPAIIQDLENVDLSVNGEAVVGALGGWDFECPTGLSGNRPSASASTEANVRSAAAGCAAFHVVFARLMVNTFSDELSAGGVVGIASPSALVDALNGSSRLVGSYWDDVSTADIRETRTAIIVKSVEEAADFLVRNLGATVDDWMWGKIHTLTLRADLFDGVGITLFNNGPWANDGGLFTIDVANPTRADRGDFSHRSGASMRFACALDMSGVDCTLELPGGQRHFEGDPNYEDLLMEYLVNKPFALPFTAAEVEAVAVERELLTSN